MKASLEETQIDLADAPLVDMGASRWDKYLLVLVLGLAGALMVAWLTFLGWIASWILFALWP